MKTTVSGKTKLCGIFGDPVEHSLSPAMHNAAFRELGLDYVYVPFHVKQGTLAEAIAGIRALNIRGINVTIPHKVAVIHQLDKLEPLAEKIGAVNTVVNDEGVLTGYNTDATGFLKTLSERSIDPEGKQVLILGAGGAARAVSFALAEVGASLVITNRMSDRARELAGSLSQAFSREISVLAWEDKAFAERMEEMDIVVNATSAGMTPRTEETPLNARFLKPGLTVYDIVYNPVKTRLLGDAEAIGATTIGGLEMLVWQGALAFEKWTGQPAPVKTMREAVTKLLE